MEAEEVRLMKGNEAIAHAAIRYGVDGYFGYPITPQTATHYIDNQCRQLGGGDIGNAFLLEAHAITSLELDSARMEENNHRFQATYKLIEQNEVRYQTYYADDADYLMERP